MRVRKTACTVLILCMTLTLSCAREDKREGSTVPETGADRGSRSASGNAPPTIRAASLNPPHATAITPLSAQFNGTDAEGDFIQYVFRWFVDGEPVQEGPKGSLDPGPYKKGSRVQVEIVPSDRFSSGRPYRTEAVTIANAPPGVSSISLTPDRPTVGAMITAAPVVSDPDGDKVSIQYQWFVNNKAVSDPGDNSEFSTQGLRKKDTVAVIVTPSDGESKGDPKASNILVVVNSAPRITSAPPYEINNGTYRYQVTAQDPDGDRLTYTLVKSPGGMTIDPSTGLIIWGPTPVAAREEVTVKVEVSDGDGGTAYQEYSFIVEPG